MDGYIPVIRSGEFFTDTDGRTKKEYLDLLSAAPADMVDPAAVFGVNGWARRLEETGADPVLAKRAFDYEWERMDPRTRVQTVFGNMLDRFYLQGIQDDVVEGEYEAAEELGAALTSGTGGRLEGYLACSGPGEAARVIETKLFGPPPPARGA